jgi:pyrroline-5-carboxylate reductase
VRIGKKLGFIGAGNMAEALIKGLLATGAAAPGDIWASDRRLDHLAGLAKEHGINVGDNTTVARAVDVIVLSVKPQVMDKVLAEIGPVVGSDKLFVSIAAGVPIEAIERRLHPPARIIRTMPNTPALVGAGATALAAGEHATEDDLAVAERIFKSVGITVVLDEVQLDAVTGLSGSGPAYVFLIIEALSDAGVKVGLSRYNASALAAQTLLGSAKLLIDTKEHPGVLKDRVTSPGGTAIAGLHTLEAGGLRTTLINAVEAATNRSRELGEEFLKKLV